MQMITNLKEIRTKAGLTQQQLADQIDVGRTTVTMWESGANIPPTKYLVAIAEALSCTVDELLNNQTA